MAPEVFLRPMIEADLDTLEPPFPDPAEMSEHEFFGFGNPGRLRRDFAEGRILTAERGRLVVAIPGDSPTGELVGDVGWIQMPTGPTSFSWNIGIWLRPAMRGRGYGTRAQRLLAEYLLAHTMMNRVVAETETSNLAEQRALEKAGFTREGVLRGACYRAGQWRDMVAYSLIRADLDRPAS
jgi:RimJ/RimL family protein N-acetyltransferase